VVNGPVTHAANDQEQARGALAERYPPADLAHLRIAGSAAPAPAMPGANCRPPLASNSSTLVLSALKPRSPASRAAALRSSSVRTAGRSMTLPSKSSAQRARSTPQRDQ